MARHGLQSSSFAGEWTYDVFLSFRGEDTRTNFTGHLYNALRQKGIHTFMDDVGLQRGEEITPALTNAIQQSRIAIIVFSENYASSTFCLDELVSILDFVKGEGRLVWPVFYGVDPTQVRHQKGSYAEALAKHEERFQANEEKVRKWREALCAAANLSGSHYQHGSEYEYKFISMIIEGVSKRIDRTPLHVADHPVGLESSVQAVTALLGLGSAERVIMVGIYGIGGVGKTTLARAVYNLIGDQFEGLCFLADIREKAINKQGLVQLQETLLSEFVAEKDIKLGDVNRGIPIIKRRLCQKKILLILDDVDKHEQLRVIAGGPDWFGYGSRIIITTRNKDLLTRHGVEKEKLYEVTELNVSQSLELLSWNAFNNYKGDPIYVDVSHRAVFYAGGLPLALEVIGSNLFGKGTQEWNSLLDTYEMIPNNEVLEILKVSYDSLEENEKQIFLDIACFFNKLELSYVKGMLYAHGLKEEFGIRALMDKSLIKIDGSNCVRMHDLIQDMGREIVRQESTFEPGNRSRLWSDEEIVHVLEENTGTEKIEVIMLDSCKGKEVRWSGEAFKKMKNLKILIIWNACFFGGPSYLPNTLRVLDWSQYPSSCLPPDFMPKKLVILSLPESCLQIFKPLKIFHSLCHMNFDGCKSLEQVPNLSGLPNLWQLYIDNCTNLKRFHHSIGYLSKLRLLSAQGCTKLKMLSSYINLTSLETLDLRWCTMLEVFPEVVGTMENIRAIYLDETAIEKLPFSIGNFIGLRRLYLRHCRELRQLPNSIFILPKLEVVLAYGSRGFQISRGYEIQGKQWSEVPLARIFSYSLQDDWEGSPLYVYCINKSETNFIKVCGPASLSCLMNSVDDWQSTKNPRTILRSLGIRSESSVSFWFTEKFPEIDIFVIGGSKTNIDNSILDVKLRVIVNGAEQLICLSNYILTQEEMSKHIICCGLRCKQGTMISTRGWNHVEVSWELKYHRPYDPNRAISDHNGIQTSTIDFSAIHVREKEKGITENIWFTNPDVSLSQPEMMEKEVDAVSVLSRFKTFLGRVWTGWFDWTERHRKPSQIIMFSPFKPD